jgi:hypothetical protein
MERWAEGRDEIDRGSQPYDASMRRWAEANLAAFAGWLDPSVACLPKHDFARQPASFAIPILHGDLLFTAGRGRLMHVEYETSPDGALVIRLFNCRGRIMSLFPEQHLTQYVIVLGDGKVTGHDDLANGFILDVTVICLREMDSAVFLADPVLAPLAVLARGSEKQREQFLAEAFQVIMKSNHPQNLGLLETAEALALIRLPAKVVTQIRKGTGMALDPFKWWYINSELGAEYREEIEDRCRERVQERVLLAFLRSRFAERSEVAEVAHRLASWPEGAAIEAVVGAADPAELLKIPAPAQA